MINKYLLICLMINYLMFQPKDYVKAEVLETHSFTDYEIAQLIKPAFSYDEDKTFALDQLENLFIKLTQLTNYGQDNPLTQDILKTIIQYQPTKTFNDETNNLWMDVYVAVDSEKSIVLSIYHDQEGIIPQITYDDYSSNLFNKIELSLEDFTQLIERDDLQELIDHLGNPVSTEIDYSQESLPIYRYRWFNLESEGVQEGEINGLEVKFFDNEIIEYGYHLK